MGTRYEQAMLALAGVIPAAVALLHAENVAGAAHDAGIVRTVGLGWTGPWHALDAWVAAPFLALPLGTQVFRAAMGSAVACGVAGAVFYSVVRALLAACAETRFLGPTVAAIASLMAGASVAWQTEAMSPGGATLGAALVGAALLALATRARWGLAAGLVALVYEPWTGLAALGALLLGEGVALFFGEKKTWTSRVAMLGAGAAVAPLLWGLLRRGRTGFLTAWMTKPGAPVEPVAFAYQQLGWLALGLAGVGLVVALVAPRARALAVGLVAVLATSVGALFYYGVPAGPMHFASVTLAGLAALTALAAVAMQALVVLVRGARMPLASASAAMIVLLEVAFPVVLFDESAIRSEERTRALRVAWHEALFGELPSRTVFLANDARFLEHLTALRVAHLLRDDLAFVSTSNLGARPAMRELAREPKLAVYFRDMALGGAPTEWGLTTLASERPLAVLYQPAWDRTIARHVIPSGVVDLFHPEPRSTLERKRALDAFAPVREKWERMLAAPENPDARALIAIALHARAEAFAATRERDLASRTDDDLRALARETP